MDAADERRLQMFLPLSFPIHHPSIFSFHSPAPLFLSHTSLPLSFFEPTNLLFPLLFRPHFYSSPHTTGLGLGFLLRRMPVSNGLMLSQCAAKGCLTDLFITHHSFIMKRYDDFSHLAHTGSQISRVSRLASVAAVVSASHPSVC